MSAVRNRARTQPHRWVPLLSTVTDCRAPAIHSAGDTYASALCSYLVDEGSANEDEEGEGTGEVLTEHRWNETVDRCCGSEIADAEDAESRRAADKGGRDRAATYRRIRISSMGPTECWEGRTWG